jgi:hypothetical protein
MKGVLLALVLLASTLRSSHAQRGRIVEEPQFLKFRLTESSLGLYSEMVHEETVSQSGNSSSFDRFFIGPIVTVGAQGSIYHPNLAWCDLRGEFSPGWTMQETSGAGSSLSSDGFEWLGNANAEVSLLRLKPYRAQLFASQTHTFRDFDFFNSVTVDSRRYGAHLGYQAGPVPIKATVYRRTEEYSGLSADSLYEETGLTLEALNERERGETVFNYTFADYTVANSAQGGGTDHSASISDTEYFGAHRQARLTTSAGMGHREYSDSPSDDLNGGVSFGYEITPRVTATADGDYYHSENAGTSSDNLSGSAGVQHKLYESLTTSLRAHTVEYTTDGDGGGSDYRQYGLTLSEGYTKRLSHKSRLSITGVLSFSQNEQDSTGSVIPIANEQHTFPTAGGGAPERVTLNLPNVLIGTGIIVRTNSGGFPIPAAGNYNVFQNGSLTFIERVSGSISIPSGATIYVDYSAEPSPAGAYQTWGRLSQIRFDLWNGMVGIYGRVNSTENNAPPQLVARDVWAWAIGADVNWKWLRAGAEYELFDSNLSSYRSARFFQSANFRPDGFSTLAFDFAQTYTRYEDADRDEQYYSAIGRYHRVLNRHLGLDVEAGGSWRFGEGVDETRYALRPGIEFQMGQLTVKAGYDFEYSEFLHSEERIKHLLFIKAKRSF